MRGTVEEGLTETGIKAGLWLTTFAVIACPLLLIPLSIGVGVAVKNASEKNSTTIPPKED